MAPPPPKRSNNTGSKIRLRKDGLYESKVTIPGNGKRVTVYGKTEGEVEQKRAELLSDIGRNVLPPEQITLEEWLTVWLDDEKTQVRPRTHAFYASNVRRHILPALGKLKLTEITPRMVNKLLNDLDGTLSPQSRKHVRAILRQALEDAMREGYVHRNVAKLSNPVRMSRRRVQYLDVDQARQFLHAIRGHRLEPLFVTAIATGMRQGELMGLRWHDVDLDRGLIHIRYQLQPIDGTWQLVEPKSETSKRTIPIPGTVVQILHHQRYLQRLARESAGERWRETEFVFTSLAGGPLNPKTIWKCYRKLLQHAGLPMLRFHDLRHTAATLMLNLGVDSTVIKKVLGHSTITITLDTYAHVLPSGTEDAAARMGQLLAASEGDDGEGSTDEGILDRGT